MVNEAIHLANAEAALRLAQTGAPVSSIFGLSPIVPQDHEASTASMAQALFDYHWAPWVGLFRDGILQVPGRNPVERPDLVGFVDMIGFSYYGTMGVRQGRLNIHPLGAPLSPLGYGIWAGGLGLVLDRIHEELPGTAVLVAEYGIGTDDDDARAAYLTQVSPSCTMPSPAVSTCGDCSTGRPWITTSGFTATTSPLGSSTATARCGRAHTSSPRKRQRDR